MLNPAKNRSGNRVYLRREIELILLVKQLLHQEMYTIAGARRKLNQLRRGGELPAKAALAVDQGLLEELRTDLRAVLDLLNVDDGS
jgi:DNA-binding transcriptional MerR regulator